MKKLFLVQFIQQGKPNIPQVCYTQVEMENIYEATAMQFGFRRRSELEDFITYVQILQELITNGKYIDRYPGFDRSIWICQWEVEVDPKIIEL